MLKTELARFRALRPPVRGMVYLFWIYSFSGALSNIFIQLYIYQLFGSVATNIIAGAIFFTGIAIGFCLCGILAAKWRINLKLGYILAFLALCGSFIFFFGTVTLVDAFLFMFCFGVGTGLYWLTIHTFELTETKNHERDYYSSVLSFGGQIIGIVAPAIAVALLYLSDDVFGLGSYTLLFIISPAIYLLGIPFVRAVASYRPLPVEWADIKHFFRERRNVVSQLYMLGSSMHFSWSKSILPLAALLLLGTEKRVGIFNAIFALLAALALLFISRFRHEGNRLRFLGVTALLLTFATFLPATFFTLPVFIAYSLIVLLISPLFRISEHVIDLETMESLPREGRDFYSTMLLRDFSLWFWRMVGLFLLWLMIGVVGEGESAVRLGLYFVAVAPLFVYWGAKFMLTHRSPGGATS